MKTLASLFRSTSGQRHGARSWQRQTSVAPRGLMGAGVGLAVAGALAWGGFVAGTGAAEATNATDAAAAGAAGAVGAAGVGAGFGPGLAAKYPGDVGLEKDSRVIFVENFESRTVEALASRWETVGDKEGMTFSKEVPEGSGGGQSLIMERTKGPGAKLYRRLKNASGGWGYDRVFARYYVRFDPECGEIHHFGTCLGGNLPATPWPSVKAGQPTDGAKSFWSGIEPFGRSWTWDFYTYWCEMRGSPPRGQTWGNSFVHDPELKVAKGRWICIEQMIRMNRVGDTDGEQALWIDGRLISHLGKGFPNGRWTYDKFYPGRGGQGIRWSPALGRGETFAVPDGGVPFEGFRWRTVPELNVNYLWLYIFTQKPDGHRIKVWFDDVVVATEYIGPLARRPAAR